MDLTLAEIYALWSTRHFREVSEATQGVYRAAMKNAAPLHEKSFRALSLDDLEECIYASGVNYPSARSMRNLFSQLYVYAVPRELAAANLASYISLKSLKHSWDDTRAPRICFTQDEIDRLFTDAAHNKFCRGVLMLIYSGLRVSEFLNLKTDDCHLGERYIHVGRSKTAAGVRDVPIARKTLPYWEAFAKERGEYLFTLSGRSFAARSGYDAFYGHGGSLWKNYFSGWEVRHTVHETRHTCETMLRASEVYPAKIDAIIGHAGASIGERVYTHLSIEDLIPEIDKI